jgi:predicted GTPase
MLASEMRTGIAAIETPGEPAEAVGLVLDGERELLSEITGQLTELAAEQLTDMDNFTIALFGRTGVGKSSMVEALSTGDGASISPGDSDWTTTVRPVDWESCRVIDTPGIQGWGRTTTRSELEERARQALLSADIVLLCFDTQHQQAGEFRKVAEWIAEFGKPAIAVLNVRLPNWRFPPRAPRAAVRGRLSQTVAEHAQHIRQELAAIGIHEIPLVAVHTQRAVYASATEPIQLPEPQARALRRLRADLGAPTLLIWSNLPRLEKLLVEAIESGAGQLRRGMLLRQLVGRLDQATRRLVAEVEQPAHVLAEQNERGIEQMLAVLGAPENYTGTAAEEYEAGQAAARSVADQLRALEHARGCQLSAPATGSAQLYAHNVIDARLGEARRAAADRAEQLVDEAMRDRTQVDNEEFHRRVFDQAELEQVMLGLVADLTAFLHDKVGLVAEDVLADLRAVRPTSASVDGAAGQTLQVGGYAVGLSLALVGGAAGVVGAAGFASALGVAAAANIWNPIGWTIALGGITASLAGPHIRKWMRQRGTRRREEELSRARGAARKAVADTFASMRDEMVTWFVAAARQAMVERIGVVADQTLLLRRVSATAAANRHLLQTAADQQRLEIRSGESASVLLAAAMRSCEAAAPAGPFGRSIWLGEDWCDDPTGLVDDPVRVSVPRARGAAHGVLADQVADHLRWVLSHAAARPEPGRGIAWLDTLSEQFADDARAKPMLDELAQLAAEPRPRVVVYGDYNAGKSSFIKRLLVDDGQSAPADLTVRGAPETAQVRTYDWLGLRLIDTPGLQSGIPGHTEQAYAQLPDAAIVIHMLGANGIVGDRTGVDRLLHGDERTGLVAKLERTVFVVNRADELGTNPFDDEEAFAQLLRRKQTELLAALGASGTSTDGRIPAERIVFVASDPGGQVGDDRVATAADFDPFRGWDGMDEVRGAFENLATDVAGNCVDVTLLHGGLARLGGLAASTRSEADAVRSQIEQLRRLRTDLDEIGQAAASIERSAVASAEDVVTGAVGQLVDAALATTVENDQKAILGRAVSFWTDQEVTQAVAEWTSDTRRRVEEWRRESAIRNRRRHESLAFRQALGTGSEPSPVQFPTRSKQRDLLKDGGSALGAVVDLVSKARHARVLRDGLAEAVRWSSRGDSFGRLMGINSVFASGRHAARIARIGSRATIGLTVVTTAADLYLLERDRRADARQEKQYQDALHQLNEQALEFARGVAADDPALEALRAEAAEHTDASAVLTAEIDGRSNELAELLDRLAEYERAVRRGRKALDTRTPEAPHSLRAPTHFDPLVRSHEV